MAIINRRNAVVGWLTIKAGKRIVKEAAGDATPSAKSGAAAGAVAVVGSALFFLRRARRGGGDD